MEVRKCNRCQYEWAKRVEFEPKRCPNCKSPYWNVDRTRPIKNKGNREDVNNHLT